MVAVPTSSFPAHEGGDDTDGQWTPELLTALNDLTKAFPAFRLTVARLVGDPFADPGPRLQLVGKARKVSVSLPEDLATAVQERVGHGSFSQYVTEAVARQLKHELLGELLAVLEAEHGPVTEEGLAEARLLWPDAQ